MDFDASADCRSARAVVLAVGWAHRYLVGARFKLYVGPESNAPDVLPPIGLVVAQMLCVLVLALTLFLAVTIQLSSGPQNQTFLILVALIGGVLPIANAYGLNTNRIWTRIGLLVNLLGLLFITYTMNYGFIIPNKPRMTLVIGSTGIFLVSLIFLYRNANIRAYYLAIRGLPIPELLAIKLSKSASKKPRFLGKFVYVAELIILVLALILFPMALMLLL